MYANITNFYNDVHLCKDNHKPLTLGRKSCPILVEKIFERQNEQQN